jgi:hypothetical protein
MAKLNATLRGKEWISFLTFLSLLHLARAENTSGAVIWWVIFVILALGSSSAFLFYQVYIVKQKLGKNHPNVQEIAEDAEAKNNRSRGSKKGNAKDEIRQAELAKREKEKNKNMTPPGPHNPRAPNGINLGDVDVNIDEENSGQGGVERVNNQMRRAAEGNIKVAENAERNQINAPPVKRPVGNMPEIARGSQGVNSGKTY